MRYRFWCGLAMMLLAAIVRAEDPFALHVAPTEPQPPREQLKRFQVPPGFEVQLVAAEPDVRKPINLAFDAAGRLYVTQSVEYPFPAQEGAGRDVVSVFSDFAPDGTARRKIIAADGLNIPIGVAPLPDSLLLYSIPNLYRFRDDNGDGRIDARETLLGPFGYRDTHGMVNSLTPWVDGWVYCCHGFANDTQFYLANRQKLQMNSGNTFRVRPDGSAAELFTHGQVNPFGLAFDTLGNVYSTDCHTLPAYQLLRSAYYPSFGKPHDGLGFGPTIMSHSHGSTGLAGIVYYAAEHFPPEYRDTLFIGNPITRRINHDKLRRQGASFTAVEQPDFLFCDDPWFRPVHLQLGPDGALYIADFYNRIIGHYEVPLTHPLRDRERGRIWRVVYKGKQGDMAELPAIEDLTQMDARELVQRLALPNLTVQVRAVWQLVARGQAGADAVRVAWRGTPTTFQRAFGLWVLERLGQLDAAASKQLSADSAALVRVHWVKAMAERNDWSDEDWLYVRIRELLFDEDAFVRRAAAEALGRHPHYDNIQPLCELWNRTPTDDGHLVHSVRMALRDHVVRGDLGPRLADEIAARPIWAAQLADVSLGAASPGAAQLLASYLASQAELPARSGGFVRHIVRYSNDEQLAKFWQHLAGYRSLPPLEQQMLLRSAHRGAAERGTTIPAPLAAWQAELGATLLASDDASLIRAGLECMQEWRLAGLFEAAAPFARRDAPHPALRSLAIDACAAARGERAVPLLQHIVADAAETVDLRRKAASALGVVQSDTSRAALVAVLPTAPTVVAQEIALGLARSAAGAEQLLTLLEAGKATARLLQDPNIDRAVRAARPANGEARIARLLANLPPADARLAELIQQRRQGFAAAAPDLARGQAVYKKSCAACHKLGNEGIKVGPELDGIGHRGLDRLLEDILDPNRNVDQAFRALIVQTKDGRTVQGLKLREEGDVLVLADKDGKEIRLSASEIEAQELTRLSPMPSNVSELLSADDLYSLLGFLLQQRQPGK